MRSFAQAGDTLSDLHDADGNPLGIDLTNPAASLTIGGSVGGTPVTDHTMAVGQGTTLADIMQGLQYALGLNSNPVVLNDQADQEWLEAHDELLKTE